MAVDKEGLPSLTAKQALFCEEYIVDLNGTQAAIRAGYSEDTARFIASENLTKPNIKARVSELIDLRSKRTQITADKVLVELAKIGFADVRKIFGDRESLLLPSQYDDDTASSIQSVEVVTKNVPNEDGEMDLEYVHKIRLCDKKGALELLGKHLKLFTDKHEHTGKDGERLILPSLTSEEIKALAEQLDDEC